MRCLPSNVIVKIFALLVLLLEGIPLRATWGGLASSGHNFSGKAWLSGRSACSVCHSSPTSASANENQQYRWNHPTTSSSFTPYSSPTLKARPGQPQGASLFCMSCHDGTVPIDAFEGKPGSEKCRKIMGTDLSKIHPVSFVYDDALADVAGHLKRPSETLSGLGGTIQTDLLVEGKMECTSCHEPHDRFNERNMLIRRDRGGSSGLCGICHTSNPPGTSDMGHWE